MNDALHLSNTRSATREGGVETPVAQTLSRDALRASIANAIDHARLAQRVVGVLIVYLARSNRLDAMVGTPTGDMMPEAMRRLTVALRPNDRVVRLTDEKICVLLPNLRNDALALLAAGRIQQVFEVPFVIAAAAATADIADSDITLHPIIGIAVYPAHANDADELLVHADTAKRIARQRDVSQHVFQPDDQPATASFTGLSAELRAAIQNNQLEVYYQPKVDLKTGRCTSVEALLRWTLPGRGAIAPPVIVSIAESNGTIGVVTEWVLNTALRHQSEWKRAGIDLSLAVNLSTKTLADADLPGLIAQTLGTWQADPACLTLEITESATISDMNFSLTIMKELKEIGVALSVDDFGTGYSSLSYVKKFPLDELKIDRLFVQHMLKNKGDQRIVRSIIELAHNFELTVVAEGVEDERTMAELTKMNCDMVQGFVVSEALPSEKLVEWLRQR